METNAKGYPRVVRGRVRGCVCSKPRPHGTPHTYQVHGCGCDACRDAFTRYKKRSTALARQGRTLRVPAAVVAERVDLLAERGMAVRQIAEAAGVSSTAVYQLVKRERPTVTRAVHDRVLAVKVPPRPKLTGPRRFTGCECRPCYRTAVKAREAYDGVTARRVPAGPVLARWHKLRRAGMSAYEVSALAGVPPKTLWGLRHRESVSLSTALGVLSVSPSHRRSEQLRGNP